MRITSVTAKVIKKNADNKPISSRSISADIEAHEDYAAAFRELERIINDSCTDKYEPLTEEEG